MPAGRGYVKSLEGSGGYVFGVFELDSLSKFAAIPDKSIRAIRAIPMQIDFFLHMRSPSHLHCMVHVLQSSGAAKLCLPSISKMAYTLLVSHCRLKVLFLLSKQYLEVFSFVLFAEAIIPCVTLQSKRTISGFTEFYEHSDNSNLPYI